ncbi:MAG: 4-hydroxy-tetrahydrodipicolinate reductase [Candidatus Symbiodolus clandestinus]
MNPPAIGVTIAGAAGKMGQALLQAIPQQPALVLRGALVASHSPWIGQTVEKQWNLETPSIQYTADLAIAMAQANVLIDFTTPIATRQYLTFCQQQRKALVIGTTGLTEAIQQQIAQVAQHIAILTAANFSLGVQLLYQLATLAASHLGQESDIDIIEHHHRHKRDLPSGTALELAKQVAQAADFSWPTCRQMLQEGIFTGRQPQTIQMVSVRSGEKMGEHTIQFTTATEQLTISHQANSRQAFAQGALQAAQWLAQQPPGLYRLSDIVPVP